MDDALRLHSLPEELRRRLVDAYGGPPPETWHDALERLRDLSGGSTSALWSLIMDHPLTAYVPVQCQRCGRVVPDETHASPEDDAAAGLSEVQPTDEERPHVRSGWFRGPRGPVVFVLRCPECGATSRWYRSSDPEVVLNPSRWGRLCGEQEDLRLHLAAYLDVDLRTAVPLDWDHVWSEYRCAGESELWAVHDGPARNFASRLDEGIRAWTGVLVVSPDPSLCGDATDEYLRCRNDDEGGRADPEHSDSMPRWREIVDAARRDASGALTQAKTLNGYVLHRAGLSSKDITEEVQRAAEHYGKRAWWQL